MARIAREERLGLPVGVHTLTRFAENWEALQLHYIRREDDLGLGGRPTPYRLSA